MRYAAKGNQIYFWAILCVSKCMDVVDRKFGLLFLKVSTVNCSPLLVQLIYKVAACNSKGLMVSSDVSYYLCFQVFLL